MSAYLTERILYRPDGSMPHMGVKEGDVAPYVLISGSPGRVLVMKDKLQDARAFGSDRGAVVYTGTYKGVPVTVASTGMGGPSLAIAVEELAVTGGKVFIRTGSCASIQENIPVGDLIVATASVRDEGTSDYYAPKAYPSVADVSVIQALCQAMDNSHTPYHLGLIRSSDSFYEGERKAEIIDTWRPRNVLAFEMEASALFTIANVRGFRSGCIIYTGSSLALGLSPIRGESVEARDRGVARMIAAALDAVVLLAQKDGLVS
ncbi:MAG: nucleoside phosphorylase [Chloroflexi bacterium]|nr:nucleoside phosphorylase [Chloroflexota bacterium]